MKVKMRLQLYGSHKYVNISSSREEKILKIHITSET